MHKAAKYARTSAPAHPEHYHRVCVHGVRRDAQRRELADDAAAQFWSVYGWPRGDSPDVECFGEFATKSEAWTYALDLAAEYSWPIWDCKRAER